MKTEKYSASSLIEDLDSSTGTEYSKVVSDIFSFLGLRSEWTEEMEGHPDVIISTGTERFSEVSKLVFLVECYGPENSGNEITIDKLDELYTASSRIDNDKYKSKSKKYVLITKYGFSKKLRNWIGSSPDEVGRPKAVALITDKDLRQILEFIVTYGKVIPPSYIEDILTVVGPVTNRVEERLDEVKLFIDTLAFSFYWMFSLQHNVDAKTFMGMIKGSLKTFYERTREYDPFVSRAIMLLSSPILQIISFDGDMLSFHGYNYKAYLRSCLGDFGDAVLKRVEVIRDKIKELEHFLQQT